MEHSDSALLSPTSSDQDLVRRILERQESSGTLSSLSSTLADGAHDADLETLNNQTEDSVNTEEAFDPGEEEEADSKAFDDEDNEVTIMENLEKINLGPKIDLADHLDLGEVVKRSCRSSRASEKRDSRPKESRVGTRSSSVTTPSDFKSSDPPVLTSEVKNPAKWANLKHEQQREPLFPDLSVEGEKLARRGRCSTHYWYMPFRHGLYRQAVLDAK